MPTEREDQAEMPQTLGQRIRTARKSAKLSQSQLASRIGAHFTSVSDWERGKNAPSARHLLSIAQATGTEVGHFTGENDSDDDEEPDPVTDLARALQRVLTAREKV